MATEDRQLVAAAVGHPKAGLTTEEATRKYLVRLERKEQNTLVGWLSLNGIPFNRDRMDKRRRGTPGWPDFTIVWGGRVLLGEMKVQGNKLSDDQQKCHDSLLRSGTEVQVWSSAEVAIRSIKNWRWSHFRIWNQEEDPGRWGEGAFHD
jgi:hypothetical protein